MRIEVLIDVKTILGEGPLWDVDEQRLYFIDSFGCNVFRSEFRGRDGFVSVAGTAEATNLAGHSVQIVTSAQAFHWFDGPAARREFMRILVPGGRARSSGILRSAPAPRSPKAMRP